jgi:hypothetical protein
VTFVEIEQVTRRDSINTPKEGPDGRKLGLGLGATVASWAFDWASGSARKLGRRLGLQPGAPRPQSAGNPADEPGISGVQRPNKCK